MNSATRGDDDSEVTFNLRQNGECEVNNPFPFHNPISSTILQSATGTLRSPTLRNSVRTPSDMEEGRPNPTPLPLEQELSSQLERLSAYERQIRDNRSRIHQEIQGAERDIREHTNRLPRRQSHILESNVVHSSSAVGGLSNQTVIVVRDDHKLNTFDGKSNFANWKREALQYLQDLSGTGGVADVNRLLKFISGQAKRELLSSPSALDSVDNLFHILELAYSDQRSITQVQKAFFGRTQNASEEIMSFATDLKFLFHQLSSRIPAILDNRDEMLIDQFIQGLQSRQVAAQLSLWVRQRAGVSFALVRGEALNFLSVLGNNSHVSSSFSRNQAQHTPSSRFPHRYNSQPRPSNYRPRQDFHRRDNRAHFQAARQQFPPRYAPDWNRMQENVTQPVGNRPVQRMQEIGIETDVDQGAVGIECHVNCTRGQDLSCSKNVMSPPHQQ